jgi:hypothetical protein
MSDSHQSPQQPQKKDFWKRFAELGPAWISVIVAVASLLTGGAVYVVAVHVVAPPSPKPATSAAPQGTTPSSAAAHPSNPPAVGGSITGDWNVTYVAPATVTITQSGDVYTEFAKTRVLVFPGTSCYIQPGIAIATFTQTGPGTYAGHASLWSENTCMTDATTSMTVALSNDGNTLAESLERVFPGMLSTVILTRN